MQPALANPGDMRSPPAPQLIAAAFVDPAGDTRPVRAVVIGDAIPAHLEVSVTEVRRAGVIGLDPAGRDWRSATGERGMRDIVANRPAARYRRLRGEDMRLTVITALLLITGCSAGETGDPLGETGDADLGEVRDQDAHSGPFGYKMGQSVGDIEGAQELEPNLYEVKSPPKPHPDFEAVVLEAFPGPGVCTIRGIGRDLVNDGTGLDIRQKVDALAEALEGKYGKPRKIDVCSGDDITCREDFWMMFLGNGRRAYGYSWDSQNPAMEAAGISSIAVGAQAADISTSYPILEFYSADADKCQAAKNSASAAAL
jgi:hypothetical protein